MATCKHHVPVAMLPLNVCVCAAVRVFVSMCIVYNAVGTLTIYCIKIILKLSLWTQFDRKEDTCAPLLLDSKETSNAGKICIDCIKWNLDSCYESRELGWIVDCENRLRDTCLPSFMFGRTFRNLIEHCSCL